MVQVAMKQATIIIGGYNSIWPAYLKMARDLEDLTGLHTVGVPLMPWDWWYAQRAEDGTNLLAKVQDTVVWAHRRFQAERFILVGHSAGGVLARLYLHDGPVWGRVYTRSERVTTLITLGSPHCGNKGAGTGWFLTDEANRLVPGTPRAPQVYYRAVAGRYLQGCQDGDYRKRRAFHSYQFFGEQSDVWGDGVIPVGAARLNGAELLILEGVAHSRKFSRNWYGGSKGIIRHWWPQVGGE
jgi:pimeloyl-ACP methyl ester carboxylesterase